MTKSSVPFSENFIPKYLYSVQCQVPNLAIALQSHIFSQFSQIYLFSIFYTFLDTPKFADHVVDVISLGPLISGQLQNASYAIRYRLVTDPRCSISSSIASARDQDKL